MYCIQVVLKSCYGCIEVSVVFFSMHVGDWSNLFGKLQPQNCMVLNTVFTHIILCFFYSFIYKRNTSQ